MFLKCNILWLKSSSLPSTVLKERSEVGCQRAWKLLLWGTILLFPPCFLRAGSAHCVLCLQVWQPVISFPGRPISGTITSSAFHAVAFLSTWTEQWSPAVEPAHDLPWLLCAIRHENGSIGFFVVWEENVSWTQDNNLDWNGGKPHTFVSYYKDLKISSIIR